MATRALETFESFHRLVPSIVRRLNEDTGLALRAMANPILALEEMGLQLAPALRREVELRLRFGGDDRERLEELSERIREHTKEEFDPESDPDVEELLFRRLKLSRPEKLEGQLHRRPTGTPVSRRPDSTVESQDKLLEGLREDHPIVEPLLEYRRIAARRPGFASRERYDRLRTTDRPIPVSSIRIDIPEHEEHEEDDNA
jgi:hypothetical protein